MKPRYRILWNKGDLYTDYFWLVGTKRFYFCELKSGKCAENLFDSIKERLKQRVGLNN